LLHVGEGLHTAVWHQHHWDHHNSRLSLSRACELVAHVHLLVYHRLTHHHVVHHQVLSATEDLQLFHLLVAAGGLSAEDLGGVSVVHVTEVLPPPGI